MVLTHAMMVVRNRLPPMMMPCSKKPTDAPFGGRHRVGGSAIDSFRSFLISSALGFEAVSSEVIVDESAEGVMYSGCGMVNHDTG